MIILSNDQSYGEKKRMTQRNTTYLMGMNLVTAKANEGTPTFKALSGFLLIPHRDNNLEPCPG